MLLFLIKVAEMSPNLLVCDNDARVKLSVLNGLREQHVLKQIRIMEMEKEVDNTRDKMDEIKLTVVKMQRKINAT